MRNLIVKIQFCQPHVENQQVPPEIRKPIENLIIEQSHLVHTPNVPVQAVGGELKPETRGVVLMWTLDFKIFTRRCYTWTGACSTSSLPLFEHRSLPPRLHRPLLWRSRGRSILPQSFRLQIAQYRHLRSAKNNNQIVDGIISEATQNYFCLRKQITSCGSGLECSSVLSSGCGGGVRLFVKIF